jgi:hypothetical protein
VRLDGLLCVLAGRVYLPDSEYGGMATSPKESAPDIVGVPAAAHLLGITPQAVRNNLRAGTLKGTKLAGKWGPAWHFRPGVLQAFAADRYGRAVDVDALQAVTPATGGNPRHKEDGTLGELYERILTLTNELADVKAIGARAEGKRDADVKHLQDALAEAKAERDAETARAAEAEAKAEALAGELERAQKAADAERDRPRPGFFARVFGGN